MKCLPYFSLIDPDPFIIFNHGTACYIKNKSKKGLPSQIAMENDVS